MNSEWKNTVVSICRKMELIREDVPVSSDHDWFEARKLVWVHVKNNAFGSIDHEIYDRVDFSQTKRTEMKGLVMYQCVS